MSKYVSKVTRTQAVVKVTGTSTSEIIDTGELLFHDQTLDRDNVSLTITSIIYNVSAAANVTRDGNVIFAMAGNTVDEHNFAQSIGFSMNEKPNANVVVNVGTGESTVILQFSKEAGYIDPEQQTLQPFER